MTTAMTTTGPVTIDRPALSAGAAVLYAASALDLKLTAPQTGNPVVFTHERTKMAGFPSKPARFVGRVAGMSRALARPCHQGSSRPAIVLHGMAEIGKTAFARELAYTQRDNFPTLIWHAVTQRGSDNIRTAVADLAATLDQEINGLGAQAAGQRRSHAARFPARADPRAVRTQPGSCR